MSGLRCWPGAVAYITSPWAVRSEHGMLVTVVRRAVAMEPVASRDGGVSRSYGPAGKAAPAWVCEGRGDRFPCVIADRCLRPVLPPPEAESTTTDADQPQPAEVA